MCEYKLIVLCLMTFAFISFVSAGIGIRSYQESALVNENNNACLTYGAYNPFSTDTQVIIGISDSLKEVLVEQEAESKLIPAGTSSDKAIPLKFCFKAPKVYSEDCLIAGFICKEECKEEQKSYVGEVELRSISTSLTIGGTGGSATSFSVSSPLRIRVNCTPHARNYTIVYVLLAVISATVIGTILMRKYRKPKVERDKEKLQKIRAQIAKEGRKSVKRHKRK